MKRMISFLCALFLISAVTGCDSSLKVSVKEDIEAEYGTELDYRTLYDQDSSSEDIVVKEVKNYDKHKLGEQLITVIFADQKDRSLEQDIKINVKDTQYPTIKLKKDTITLTEGDKFDAAANIESVSDPVDGELKKSDSDKEENGYFIQSDVNNNKAGSYTVIITACDSNGNKAQKNYKVEVKAKPTPQPSVSKQSATGSESNSNPSSSSTTSTSSSQTQPSATQQTPPAANTPAPEPVGNKVYIAGSGNGKRYHSNPNCSNMKNPVEISLSEAQARGYTACKKCY